MKKLFIYIRMLDVGTRTASAGNREGRWAPVGIFGDNNNNNYFNDKQL